MCFQAFHIAHTEAEILQVDSKVAKEVIYTELTIIEFAEALSMKPDAEFVKKVIFTLNQMNNIQICSTYFLKDYTHSYTFADI